MINLKSAGICQLSARYAQMVSSESKSYGMEAINAFNKVIKSSTSPLLIASTNLVRSFSKTCMPIDEIVRDGLPTFLRIYSR